ncbi:DUF736 domain-containing protein [Microvirgula aerodenitrificans]|uniref:DUF736 domain-containing protein n=1 Tax=Microvirgula aerodenitrificans TaxID=57480 RepID=UPI00402BA0B3
MQVDHYRQIQPALPGADVGQLRTLTLNVKVKLVPNDKGESESAPDFRLQATGRDFGAAWKKTSEAGQDYLSVAIDDPSFPATV